MVLDWAALLSCGFGTDCGRGGQVRQTGGVTAPAASSVEAVQDRWGLWPVRILWFLLPLLVGPSVGSLAGTARSVVVSTAETGLWLGWFVGLVALLAPSTVSLTTIRILAPIAPIGTAATSILSGVYEGGVVLAFVGSLTVAAVVFLPNIGDLMVNGSSYGAERRLALRPPAGVLLGPAQAAWLACALGLTVGPLLLATESWWLGFVALGVGLTAALRGAKALHQLSKRWIVFVPVGVVIHDYYVLAESILMQRKTITEIGPAPAEPKSAADLSGGAMGLALQISLSEPVPLAIKDAREVLSTSAPKLIFTPSLPGRLLAEARIRGLKLS